MPEMAGHPTKRKQLESCIESRATCYYGFEPNPLFTTQLNTLEAEQRAAGYQVITLRGIPATGSKRAWFPRIAQDSTHAHTQSVDAFS